MKSNLLAIGLMIALASCQSSPKKQEAQTSTTDTTLIAAEETQVLENPSDAYFDQALVALQTNAPETAVKDLQSGIAALKVEGKNLKGENLSLFDNHLKDLEKLVERAKEKKLTEAELNEAVTAAELTVGHQAIEDILVLPEVTTDPLKVTLNDLEKHVGKMDKPSKEEGLKLINTARTSLDAREKAAKQDAKKMDDRLRQDLKNIQTYIKKHA
ncbi:hypothetical protein [Siphonobacter sp. SORGH_AS_1065]|uniref:hypothetical protein n=1 Tax=Siphonobacter sp. SORGH_AS_1065 TaxID=3041795 RepID=UPI0027838CF0|nr:hypothetical protein [Siphonobacter sp. SORGH_AS_1065]MDQ1090178.1 benzoyl-CoA reductase/2-hydroxyglutaryl-CoA dehydratase subunit BcrC/BadD/HgdB [Siphonobacter sp. SORGH_AS_1065]